MKEIQTLVAVALVLLLTLIILSTTYLEMRIKVIEKYIKMPFIGDKP